MATAVWHEIFIENGYFLDLIVFFLRMNLAEFHKTLERSPAGMCCHESILKMNSRGVNRWERKFLLYRMFFVD